MNLNRFTLAFILSLIFYSPFVLAEDVGGSVNVIGVLLQMSIPFLVPVILATGLIVKVGRITEERLTPADVVKVGILIMVVAVGLVALIGALMA